MHGSFVAIFLFANVCWTPGANAFVTSTPRIVVCDVKSNSCVKTADLQFLKNRPLARFHNSLRGQSGSDILTNPELVGWMEKLKSAYKSGTTTWKNTGTIRQVSETLQSLLIEGIKRGEFDHTNIEFLVSILSKARAPFDAKFLGEGPWQAV
jgi:hypothetical protein